MVFKICLFINQDLSTNTIKLKEHNYTIGWKSKGIYNFKLTPSNTTFLHEIKLSRYKMGIQFNKSVLVVEQI